MVDNQVSTLTSIAQVGQIATPIIVAFFAFIVMRMKLGFEKFKTELIETMDKRYVSKAAHDEILRSHEGIMANTSKTLDDTKGRFHTLHEDFIAHAASKK